MSKLIDLNILNGFILLYILSVTKLVFKIPSRMTPTYLQASLYQAHMSLHLSQFFTSSFSLLDLQILIINTFWKFLPSSQCLCFSGNCWSSSHVCTTSAIWPPPPFRVHCSRGRHRMILSSKLWTFELMLMPWGTKMMSITKDSRSGLSKRQRTFSDTARQ